MVGIVGGRAARLILRSSRVTHPVPGSRGHWQKKAHANTRTTEKVYRKELRPVLRRGAKAMDDLFKAHQEASEPPNLPPASSENQTER